MSALHAKLRRDLLRMWPQLAAASLVMACGIGALVMSLSMLRSLEAARDAYYERYRFPQVFAQLKRAPNSLLARIAEIPGVESVQGRVQIDVNLDVADMVEPAVGRIVSIPESPPYGLCELHVRRGRLPEVGNASEVVASEAFAESHHLEPGDSVRAIINGRLETLLIVGLALSPEYIYQVRPGDLVPDERRFGIFWMPYRELAPAYDLDGAFNHVVVSLEPGASERAVIDQIDRLTEPYGGQGAVGRTDQTSHKFVANELHELRAMSMVPPTIFLSAAAFILNIVFARVVRTQREQIAALKAFGYSRFAVGKHYLEMSLVVAAIGISSGVALGWVLGNYLSGLYARFFRFPSFDFALDGQAVALASGVALVSCCAGILASVYRASRLPPAEAMRPEVPPDYRTTLLERWRLQGFFTPAGRMVIRHLERQPLRAVLSTLGISLAVAVLIVGSFVHGSIVRLMEFMFFETQRQDLTVGFVEPRSSDAVYELAGLPGVLVAEPFRSIPARLRAGSQVRLQGITALDHLGRLYHLIDQDGRDVAIPKEGIVIGDILAEKLAVGPGDMVRLEVLEGERPTIELPVAAVARTYVGETAFMDRAALNRLLREGNVSSGAFLRVEEDRLAETYATLKSMPGVGAVGIKRSAIESFEATIAENILRIRLFNLFFACVIAFGVLYNSARIALAERAHELATLRILGFTRREVSMVLLGELAVLTGLAIPLGLLIGRGLVWVVVGALGGDIIRMPLVINPSTYAFAVTVITVAAWISGAVVRRGVNRLDLVEVLKTKG